MRSRFQALALALSLSAMPVPHLSAQPPVDLPPRVDLQEVVVVGSDLAATFNWSADVEPLPPGARLKLLDSQGVEVGSAGFIPIVGSQTVWIPGGALPRAGTTETWPLERQIVLLGEPSRIILVEKGVSVNAGGPVVIMAPRWPLPFATGRVCNLYVDSLLCHDSEDHNGDEAYLVVDASAWYHDPVDSGKEFFFNWPIVLCDTCKDIRRTIEFNLWDLDDPGFPVFDPDDHLGYTQEAGCSPVNNNIQFQGRHYTYYLRYHVTCYEVSCP